MYLNFDPDFVGLAFNATTCYALTGFMENELIKLTGIYAYTHDFEMVCFEGVYPDLRIAVECTAITIVIVLQIGEGVIRNELVHCYLPGTGIGISIFSAQVKSAIDAGFHQILCIAAGNYNVLEKWNGYITWAKFGFVIDSYFNERFLKLLAENGRKETTLSQLMETENGAEFWTKNGISWPGKFDLYDGSESRLILDKYKIRKGLF